MLEIQKNNSNNKVITKYAFIMKLTFCMSFLLKCFKAYTVELLHLTLRLFLDIRNFRMLKASEKAISELFIIR